MPEIWLGYGATNIVLDIRFENLSNQISSELPFLAVDEIKSLLWDSIKTDDILICVLSGTKSTAKVIAILYEIIRDRGFTNMVVDVVADSADALRMELKEKDIPINRIDYKSLQERLTKFRQTIFICHTSFDPLFGYKGVPSMLVRNFFADKMNDAFCARNSNVPVPGTVGPPLKIALAETENIPAISIEIVANAFGISHLYTGSISESFLKAIEKLRSISQYEVQQTRSAIISASSENGPHFTLASSLNSLWNSIQGLKENGSAILLAENRHGVGGGALQMFVEGRLKLEDVEKTKYIHGLEHLLFIHELKSKFDLGILSSIPYFYLKIKLGFNVYQGMKDALDKILAKHGKYHKVLVVSDADNIMLKPSPHLTQAD